MTLTYVYALVRSARPPSLKHVPAGMPGGDAVRLLDAGRPGAPSRRAGRLGLWAVVSSVPDKQYGEAALARGLQNLDWVGARAVAHEAVVEHFLGAPAVLPMQLFALFTSDDRAIAHVAADRRRIMAILDRIERQHEWGVRLTWDEAAARERINAAHQGAAGRRRGSTKAGAAGGTAYLARKRDLLDVNRAQLAAARGQADRVYRAMVREATAARRRTETERAAPGSRLLLDAAFLVPTTRAASFRAALRRNVRKLEGAGVAVSLTGPWPPYNFI